MGNISLCTVKDCDYVETNGRDVFVSGKNLWLFRSDGTFVAKYKSIRNPGKIVFLPGNTALVESRGDRSYHYISLEDGNVLWSICKKGFRSSNQKRFAVSPDGSTVYDVFCPDSKVMGIDRICPEEHTYERFTFPDCLHVTRDIFFDENGVLCAVYSRTILDGLDSCGFGQISHEDGILAIPISEGKAQPYWKREWPCEHGECTSVCGCDGTYALFRNFTVLNLDTMERFSLLQDEDLDTLPIIEDFLWSYEAERRLLTVCYFATKLNIVIDCNKHKIVARYERENPHIGYQGAVVGNEFWTGTENGIVRLPFPNIDTLSCV